MFRKIQLQQTPSYYEQIFMDQSARCKWDPVYTMLIKCLINDEFQMLLASGVIHLYELWHDLHKNVLLWPHIFSMKVTMSAIV